MKPVFGEVKPTAKAIERFFEQWETAPNDEDPTLGDCLVWTGGTNEDGYGKYTARMTDGSRRTYYTHRLRFGLEVGEIPYGLELGHVCSRRACGSPDHVLPVTRQENENMKGLFGYTEVFALGIPTSRTPKRIKV